MTKEENNTAREKTVENFHKLSIQVGLNGLSFCVFDTIGNTIALSRRIDFGKELTPYELRKELRETFHQENIFEYDFSEVVVIHRNNLFSLVPKALFDTEELANYLKFNAKILANDYIEYDEISNYEIVNVYIPFMNINNYIYEQFGAFDFMHTGTVLVQALFNIHRQSGEPVCYVHVGENFMDVVILSQKQLLFYNTFPYSTKEDFLYYLLFTLEQLKLDTDTIKTRLFGAVAEGDEIYNLCYEYINKLSIFIPSGSPALDVDNNSESIDFTVLSAL
jgi:hypothetical protein